MTKGVTFSGQEVKVWLLSPADKQRLERVLDEKYKRTISKSAYMRFSMEVQLRKDEAEILKKTTTRRISGGRSYRSPPFKHTQPQRRILHPHPRQRLPSTNVLAPTRSVLTNEQ